MIIAEGLMSSSPGANSIPVTARLNLARGRVNQVAMKEARSGHHEWYIPHQLEFRSNHSVISFLFYSENLGARFFLRGVVLSHPKILNFGI
jgi:hypothetical protein